MAQSDDIDLAADQEAGLAHPRDAARLYGHDDAERRLALSYRDGTMPTAWLIGGPKGVGKATLAYRFARLLLAGEPLAAPDGPSPLDMPPHHPVARLVAAQAHPGLLVLKRPFDDKGERLRKSITVDEVRRIHAHFGLSGATRGYRVCIVDAADDLNEEGANALLKTLEEPPQRAVFLLLAHAPMRLLATIRSRCRRLMLKPLGQDDVAAILAAHAPELSDADRHLVAALSGGVPGRALMLASDGLPLYRDTLRLLADLPRTDWNELHEFAGRLAPVKADQDYAIARELFGGVMRRLVHFGARFDGISVPGEDTVLNRLSTRASLERWLDVWEKIKVLEARADALSLDRKQVVLSKFTALARVASGADSGL